jgi:hypothetical protein
MYMYIHIHAYIHTHIHFYIRVHIGFKPRAVWVKPLVQESSLCQQPYFENPNEAEEAFVQAEMNALSIL